MRAFFAACRSPERLLFEVYLCTGFRHREVATLRRRDVDARACTLAVVEKPEFRFKPKSYECRRVRVPAALIEDLKKHMKKQSGALLFPTPPHPRRPNYGGSRVDAHHLELCKQIAHRAGLNCGLCVTARGKCSRTACCERWRLHKWRDTLATGMLRSGVDVKTLQGLLGHKHLSTTEKYLKAQRLEEIAAKVENSALAAFLSPE
ncbi:MAG TPA: site-specific integrase [Acidobacteriaceae bacterium]|nr:site-specific integrase [Acidobacteriaceae bacterium]